jgi:predicted metalloprotease with PDZ domain
MAPATLVAACVLLIITGSPNVNAQTSHVRIVVTSVAPARLTITSEVPSPINSLSFLNTYGGVLGLAERIDGVEASKASGESVPVRKLAAGEFQTDESFTSFTYNVNISELARPAQMSHVSWLDRDHGLLMLADLLPQSTKHSGKPSTMLIQLDIPSGWTSTANIKGEGGQYSTDNPEKIVFLIGSSVNETSRRIGPASLMSFSIIKSGQWPFSDDDALTIVSRLIKEYSKVTGFGIKRRTALMLVPYPGEVGPGRWSAETRDNVVVLILGRGAPGKDVLTRLRIVLSHELFHLWVPNSLKLEGDYDWFFEGFTQYQALRMDLRLGWISFEDHLATIARVYDSYLASSERDKFSLVEASERRWTMSSPLVYDQGMLVAFIYDLLLKRRSDCKASLDDVYRQLFRQQATGHAGANETIIKLLSGQAGMASFTRDYIESAGEINLEKLLPTYGFQVWRGVSGTSTTKLGIGPSLRKPQRKLLGCIGSGK